jgi:hypothetical protein
VNDHPAMRKGDCVACQTSGSEIGERLARDILEGGLCISWVRYGVGEGHICEKAELEVVSLNMIGFSKGPRVRSRLRDG